jgi:hypothetical protein
MSEFGLILTGTWTDYIWLLPKLAGWFISWKSPHDKMETSIFFWDIKYMNIPKRIIYGDKSGHNQGNMKHSWHQFVTSLSEIPLSSTTFLVCVYITGRLIVATLIYRCGVHTDGTTYHHLMELKGTQKFRQGRTPTRRTCYPHDTNILIDWLIHLLMALIDRLNVR